MAADIIGKIDVNEHTLTRIPTFRPLSRTQREMASQLFLGFRYSKGKHILCQKDQSRDVHYVLAGEVCATVVSPDGREMCYEDLGPGGTFGELSAIDGQPRSASVVTKVATSVLKISRDDFWTLLQTHPVVAADTLCRLSGLVRMLSSRLFDVTVKCARTRVRTELLRRAKVSCRDDGSAVIAPAPTHQELANYIGSQREVVSRELSTLARKGIIKTNRGQIVVTDVGHLNALLGDAAEAHIGG